MQLTCYDEAMNGSRTGEVAIEIPAAETTLREIIKARVYQEVQDFNQSQKEVFRGLVQPSEAEQVLNGYKVKKGRQIDWETQAEKAVTGFTKNRFFVLVDDKQRTELDEPLTITAETTVAFVKLVPLVGG